VCSALLKADEYKPLQRGIIATHRRPFIPPK
jgi:hypothetical protein